MRDQSKNRLACITGRYASFRREKQHSDVQAFDDAFRAVRDAVIRPVLEEIAALLRQAGHAPRIMCDEARETPSIELFLGVQDVTVVAPADLVGFSVIRRRELPEVLAYLIVKPPPMDLLRFSAPADIRTDQVEQLMIDAVEHVFACHSV